VIIDTHIHLDDERYDKDFDEVLQRAKQKGVMKFIIPGADPDDIQKAMELAEKYDDIYFAVGVHPYHINQFDAEYLKKFIEHKKCVAVGECGLDYFRLDGTPEENEAQKQKQKEVFIAQIELAKEYKKPLIVHIRDASRDSKEVMMQQGVREVGGVLHCFNADEELLSLADEGFYFAIGGVITFKNAKKLVNVLAKIPKDKLLIETDGPYLTPVPYRGKRNEPAYNSLIVEKISELLEISFDEVSATTTKNAKELFHIS